MVINISAKDAFEKGQSPIIIDNTNMQCWEMKPYVAMVSNLFWNVVWNSLLMFSIRQLPHCFCIVKICCGYTRLNFSSWKCILSCYTSIHYCRSYLFIGLTLECSSLYSVQKPEPQTHSHRYIMLIVGLPLPSPRHWNMGIRCCFVSQIPGGKLNLESWRSMLNRTTNQK